MMIIKTLSRKSGCKAILNYLFKDQEKLSNEYYKPLIIRHNVRGRKIDTIAKEFVKNNELRAVKRKDAVEVYHSILSFGREDKEKITDIMLKDFAKKYIELQGKDNMYVITHHIEKENAHLHCVMSGTKYLTGEANRISKAAFGKLKQDMQQYQKEKYPELTNSLPKHGNTKTNGYAKDNRANQKTKLHNDLETSFATSTSKLDFLERLQKLGHEPYFRNEKLAGIKYEGDRKFRLEKLGYGNNKINELDTKVTEEEKQLDELQNLRDGSQTRGRETESRGRVIEEENTTEQEIENDIEEDYIR
jgi:hypothetical protein